MSLKSVAVLQCDGCPNIFMCGLERADRTREVARRSGWLHGLVPRRGRQGAARSVDLCPTCRAKEPAS